MGGAFRVPLLMLMISEDVVGTTEEVPLLLLAVVAWAIFLAFNVSNVDIVGNAVIAGDVD